MKRVTSFIFLLISVYSYSQQSKLHIGTWCSDNKNYLIKSVKFTEDDFVYITMRNNETLSEYLKNEYSISLTRYEINYASTPIELNIFLTNKSSVATDTIKWKGILRFITNNKMEISLPMYFNKEIYKDFENDDTLILEKKE
ncbi:hypothetical protein BH10BAC2_BH10BAC2_23610 [soil metagenome]